MQYVVLRPKTEEARGILEQFGDVWTVGIDAPPGAVTGERKLYLECRSDSRSKGMWVQYRHDELFEVIEF